jgi:hypothetical protein
MRKFFGWGAPAECEGAAPAAPAEDDSMADSATSSSSASPQTASDAASVPAGNVAEPEVDEEEAATVWGNAAPPTRPPRPQWLPSPGAFDSFMMDSMAVMMFPHFDGFELAMTNAIGMSQTNMFRVVHTVKLGNSQCQDGVDYTFAPQVMFGDQADRNAAQTWLVGSTDLGNMTSGRLIYAAGRNEFSLDMQLTQRSPTQRNSHNMLKWGHTGVDSSFGFKFGGSPDTTMYLGADYTQSITDKWAVGRASSCAAASPARAAGPPPQRGRETFNAARAAAMRPPASSSPSPHPLLRAFRFRVVIVFRHIFCRAVSQFYISVQQKVMSKFAVRRKTRDNVASLMCECDIAKGRSPGAPIGLQQMTLKAGYTVIVSPRLSLAAEYVLQQPGGARETEVSAGYRYRLKQSKLQGKLDSHGQLGTYLEHRTVSLPLTLLFSANVDYSSLLEKNPTHGPANFSFGYGLRFGE